VAPPEAKFEITPEMIEADERAFYRCSPREIPTLTLCETVGGRVFRAMTLARK
jgi:hypothetical protein